MSDRKNTTYLEHLRNNFGAAARNMTFMLRDPTEEMLMPEPELEGYVKLFENYEKRCKQMLHIAYISDNLETLEESMLRLLGTEDVLNNFFLLQNRDKFSKAIEDCRDVLRSLSKHLRARITLDEV